MRISDWSSDVCSSDLWDDAEDAFAWAAANAASFGGDPAMMAVGGDSAGGNLAIAVSCRRLAAGQTPPLYQLLYYPAVDMGKSEEHTSELQSLMRISYAVFCLKKKKETNTTQAEHTDTITQKVTNI